MLNSPATYTEQGRRAGRAMRHGDAGAYRLARAWFSGAIAAEAPADRPAAQSAWTTGYGEGYRVPAALSPAEQAEDLRRVAGVLAAEFPTMFRGGAR